jgi:hypothetical protein
MTFFWDVALCSLEKPTDVSEVLTASIIRAMTEGLTVLTALMMEAVNT